MFCQTRFDQGRSNCIATEYTEYTELGDKNKEEDFWSMVDYNKQTGLDLP